MGERKMLSVVCSYRFLISVLVMLGTFIQYSQKVDMSVNIICMVNHSANHEDKPPSDSCPVTNDTTSQDGPYPWDSKAQGGFLSSKFGSKYTMFISMLINGTIGSLYATMAKFGYGVIVFMRVLVGLSAGMIFPSVSQLWSRWAPIQDRSILIGFAVSGSHLGSVFTLPLGGYLCQNGFGGGWPSLFYSISIMTFIWCALWIILFADDPQQHKFLSSEEKQYIQRNTIQRKHVALRDVPWLRILKSKAFIAHTVYHTFVNWGFLMLLTMTPKYMKEVLCFDINANGLLSALPFIMIWLSTTISGIVADMLINRQIMTRTTVRKLANSIGAFGPGIFILALGFVPNGQASISVTLLTIGQLLFGVTFGAGFMCVCNDIGGSIAGIVFGMANGIGAIPGIIAPYVTSEITKTGTAAEWRTVFIIAAKNRKRFQ
ncbi:hypothetical protein GJ496_005293 [Pomphorhynchus laevis]|nr:hypothetical protein GJ496_005293 [Pomphorhynchus laevis]